MVDKNELDVMYMEMAFAAAKRSYARRNKVGAILVIPDEGRFEGINGMPSGFSNNCEHEAPNGDLITNTEVLHAESNAITKVARSRASSIGGTIYCTTSPCLECAKLIIQAGIVRVVYAEAYRLLDGVHLLQKAGIQVDHV